MYFSHAKGSPCAIAPLSSFIIESKLAYHSKIHLEATKHQLISLSVQNIFQVHFRKMFWSQQHLEFDHLLSRKKELKLHRTLHISLRKMFLVRLYSTQSAVAPPRVQHHLWSDELLQYFVVLLKIPASGVPCVSTLVFQLDINNWCMRCPSKRCSHLVAMSSEHADDLHARWQCRQSSCSHNNRNPTGSKLVRLTVRLTGREKRNERGEECELRKWSREGLVWS